MSKSDKYTLRVPFKVFDGCKILLEDLPVFEQAGLDFKLSHHNEYYHLYVEGFLTPEHAKDYFYKLYQGLIIFAVRFDIPIYIIREFGEIAYSEDPELARIALNNNLDANLEQGVDGLTNEGFIAIYPSSFRINFMAMGEVAVVRSIHSKVLLANVPVFANQINSPVTLDPKLELATELYLSSFRERSMRANFIALITALEALKPELMQHQSVLELIDSWNKQVKGMKDESEDDETKYLLDQLSNRVRELKGASISSSIRELIRTTFAGHGDTQIKSKQKQFTKLYKLRSQLVHGEKIDESEVKKSIATARELVKSILEERYKKLMILDALG